MTTQPFKGVKILTKEQHQSLREKGFYLLDDGTQVFEDPCYMYATKDGVDIDALNLQVEALTDEVVRKVDSHIPNEPDYDGWQVYAVSPNTADNNRQDTVMSVATSSQGLASGKVAAYFPNNAGNEIPADGRLIQKDPEQPYQVANKNYVDAVKDRVSLLEQQNQMMSQVIQPIEDTYSSKSFTQKMSIFDNNGMGGKSKLLSIEGNTSACKNLLNPTTLRAGDIVLTPEIVDNGNVTKVIVGNVNHTVFFYSLGVLPRGNYTFSCGGISTNKVHPNSPTEKYSVIMYINNGSMVMPETTIYPTQYTFQANGVNTVEIAFRRCTTDIDEIITITRPQLERNDYKTDFVPYYEGWRSPIITGIQSKSIFKSSNQIINNTFSNTNGYEVKAGVTLDFENNKIIDECEITWLTGGEEWELVDSYLQPDYTEAFPTYQLKIPMDIHQQYDDILFVSSPLIKIAGNHVELDDYCQCGYDGGPQILAFSHNGESLQEWKDYISANPIMIFLKKRRSQAVEETLNESPIITTFNQCTQKLTYLENQDIVSKIPIKIKQEIVVTNNKEYKFSLKPLTPSTTASNLVSGSGGDYGLHTYKFSGVGDFVYNDPIVLDYGEKLVAEFAINTTSSNYINGDGWLAITLGNTPPSNMVSYPQTSYNMVTYSSMRQIIWGSTAVNGKTSFKTGLSEIYPNEYNNIDLDSYYYKVEVTRVDLNLYNYRLSRLRKGVEDSYEIIDEIQDIKTDENSAGISSYYVQSIMIAGLGHQLQLNGLRFYKAQI